MSVYFSLGEHGFFEDHNKPDDAIAISDELHWSLVEGLARGEIIVINDAGELDLEATTQLRAAA